MEVDWTESNDFLKAAFATWLAENRPSEVKVIEMRGAGNAHRKFADDLKALGAKRLLDKMDWQHAFTLTVSDLHGKRSRKRTGLYSDRQEVWQKAARRAESVIKSLSKFYMCKSVD